MPAGRRRRRSAQRMAFHLLDKDRDGGGRLAATSRARRALDPQLRALPHADRGAGLPVLRERAGAIASQLCVVETPADLLAIEQSGAYRGRYFVLMGHLSPIDGIGPERARARAARAAFQRRALRGGRARDERHGRRRRDGPPRRRAGASSTGCARAASLTACPSAASSSSSTAARWRARSAAAARSSRPVDEEGA